MAKPSIEVEAKVGEIELVAKRMEGDKEVGQQSAVLLPKVGEMRIDLSSYRNVKVEQLRIIGTVLIELANEAQRRMKAIKH